MSDWIADPRNLLITLLGVAAVVLIAAPFARNWWQQQNKPKRIILKQNGESNLVTKPELDQHLSTAPDDWKYSQLDEFSLVEALENRIKVLEAEKADLEELVQVREKEITDIAGMKKVEPRRERERVLT